jgi:hypothetical protein
MAWKMLEKPRTVLATPLLVTEFTEMEAAPHDRPLSERRLMVYERIYRAGNFRPVVWASAFCRETANTYRVNGKHTSIMLSKLDKIEIPFYVTLERWDCDTLKDVASLYNTYDSSLASRTASDINASFAATLRELNGIPLKLINLTVTAAAFLKWGEGELKKISQSEKAEQLLDRVGFVQWLKDIVLSKGQAAANSLAKELQRTPVASAMMATYDRAPRVAKEFWITVRDESAPDRDDPTRILARFLSKAAMAGGEWVSKSKKPVGFREMYVKCIRAWNAFRTQTTTSLQYRAADPLPTVEK